MSKKPSVPLNPPDEKLAAWLDEQAGKLKSLEAKGHRLKIDFVQNARDKGTILLAVEEPLRQPSMSFKAWLLENSHIGYSTALLWMDVARHYDDVNKRFADSNPLELTVCQVRDAIRDARQERGEGKPGSGRRKANATAALTSAEGGGKAATETGEAHTADPGDQEDAADAGEEEAPDKGTWERKVAKAEAEAAAVEGGSKNEPETPLYKVTVMVFTESDQEAMQQALSNWSPITKTSAGTKQFRSVSAHAQPKAIGALLDKLGKALEQNPPKKLRVSIEL